MHDLNETLSQMTDEQISYVWKGVDEIEQWFTGRYMGVSGNGELLAASRDFTLLATTFHWLAKYFCPDTIKGFNKLYRVHTFYSPPKGNTVTLKPFKPLLSWSDRPGISIQGRDDEVGDVQIAASNLLPVFSYKSMDFFATYKAEHALAKELKKLCAYHVDLATQEREVIIFSKKPIKVNVQKPVFPQHFQLLKLLSTLTDVGLDKDHQWSIPAKDVVKVLKELKNNKQFPAVDGDIYLGNTPDRMLSIYKNGRLIWRL